MPAKWSNSYKFKKVSVIQKDLTQTIAKVDKESYATQWKLKQNALIHNKAFRKQ